MLKTHVIGITAHDDLKKTSHSPSKRSISQAPTQDKQQSHCSSMPGIPQVDARFHKHPLKTRIIGITAHENLKNTTPHANARFHKRPLKTNSCRDSFCRKTPIQLYTALKTYPTLYFNVGCAQRRSS